MTFKPCKQCGKRKQKSPRDGRRCVKCMRLRRIDWATAIKHRDGYKCVECGKSPKEKRFLQAHHIKPQSQFPKLKREMDNGITLCHWCHKKYDGQILAT